MKDYVPMLAKSKVKELGFSDKLIDELLPEPVLRPNPHHVSGPPMSLWKEADVEQAMETEVFKAHIAKRNAMREKRQAAAKKAVETKRKNLLEHVRSIIPEIEVDDDWTEEELLEAGRQSKHDYEVFVLGHYGDTSFLCTDPRTLQRWGVNFVRHRLTRYEVELDDMAGKTGCSEAHNLYHDAVNQKIAETYPFLRKECRRQRCTVSDPELIREYYMKWDAKK